MGEDAKPRVTQADRNLAADILELQERRELADFVRAGERDRSNTVQVIARHRQSAEAASRAITDDMVERAAVVLFQQDEGDPNDHPHEWLAAGDDYRACARQMLRAALSPADGGE